MAMQLNSCVSYRVLAALLAGGTCVSAPAFADSDQPIELGPVKVEDSSAKNPQTHDTGLSVLPTTVQDTPQAINVIPQEEMRQQAVSSLEGALKNVPGITIAIGEGGTLAGDQFKIRGFDAKDDIYLDGLRDFGVYTRDSFNYEEVQVLKGPSGALFGRGNTGGVINIVSKTPFLEDRYSVEGYAGNGSYFRGLADVNKVLDETTAVRLNLMGNSTGVVGRDVVKSKRWGIAPSIGFGLGTETQLTVNYLHQHYDNTPDYGLPVSVDPTSRIAIPVSENGIPRSNFLGYASDKDRGNADIVTARLSHQVSPSLTLTNDTRVGVYSRYFQYTTVDRCDELPATNACALAIASGDLANAYGGIGGSGPYAQSAWGAQNLTTARSDHDLGSFRNQLILGFDASYQNNARTFFAYTLPSASDFFYILGNHTASRSNIGVSLLDPVNTPPEGYMVILPAPATVSGTTANLNTTLHATGAATDYALFGVERFWFNDQWSVIGSLRWDSYSANYTTTTVGGTAAPLTADSSFFSPRASIVWEPAGDQTYYFSYGRSSTPQGTSIVGNATGIAVATADLKPEAGETFELGAKIGFLDGALSVTGSLFNVTKNNATQVDPITQDVLAQSGEKQRARGFELGVTGHPTPEWTVTVSYTYLDTKILESYSNCVAAPSANPPTGIICPSGVATGTPTLNPIAVGRQITFTPKHAATFWTSYDFSEFADGLTVGGGITYQSKLYNAYTAASASIADPATIVPYRIVQIPATLQLDLFGSYKIENLEFGINLINLTDRLNYAQSFGNRGTPAAGRTVLFSAGVEM
ncbi:MAG TPA: TonB-dependent receptor [Rhizomicrobium sp.]|nr:TonB-dependent receptor [Rhizomicrobium sp.]